MFNKSDDFVMLSFDAENEYSLNANENNFKVKKYSFKPAIIYGATHVPVKDKDESDCVIFPTDELPRTVQLSTENLHKVVTAVSKFVKTDDLPNTWPLEDIPFAKQANHWCNVTFFEYKHQIGNVFRGVTPSVVIDGSFSNSDPMKMSLGQLLNVEKLIVSRAIVSHIESGITLKLSASTVELISNCPLPIFIQAPIFSLMYDTNLHISTVYRLPPKANVILFDFEIFNSIMSKNNGNLSWHEAHTLQKLASVKISFAKGFGFQYRRKNAEECPCWLHIVLIDPVRIIDQILMQSPVDQTIVHSNS